MNNLDSLEKMGIISVKDVFVETDYDFKEFRRLLGTLNRTEALIWCCGLNCMVNHPYSQSIKTSRISAMKAVFDNGACERIGKFAEDHGGFKNTTVMFKGQLFELIRWVCLFCPNEKQTEDMFNDPKIKMNFAKALLMASQIWCNRISSYKFQKVDYAAGDRGERMAYFRQLSLSFNKHLDVSYAIGRGFELLHEHFSNRYADCDAKLQSVTGLSLKDYFCCLCLIIENYLKENNIAAEQFLFHKDIFSQGIPDKRAELEKFVEITAQSVEKLSLALWNGKSDASPDQAGPYNLLPLRDAPLLQTADGRMIILDPLFLLEKATTGPLFALASLTRGIKGNREPFATFGLAFEDYVCQALNRAFNTGTGGLVKRFARKLKEKTNKTDEIIDACLNNFDKAVLFEMKSFFIAEPAMLNEDPGEYQKVMFSKYEHGLDQLVTAIKNLQDKTWVPAESNQDFNPVKIVYPVLVTHDWLFDSPTQTDYLAEQFRVKLGCEPTSGFFELGRFSVVPLIILTVDILERLEYSMLDFDFIELLNDYHHHSPKRTDGLFDFLGQSDKYEIRANERLSEKYKAVIELAHEFAKNQKIE